MILVQIRYDCLAYRIHFSCLGRWSKHCVGSIDHLVYARVFLPQLLVELVSCRTVPIQVDICNGLIDTIQVIENICTIIGIFD